MKRIIFCLAVVSLLPSIGYACGCMAHKKHHTEMSTLNPVHKDSVLSGGLEESCSVELKKKNCSKDSQKEKRDKVQE